MLDSQEPEYDGEHKIYLQAGDGDTLDWCTYTYDLVVNNSEYPDTYVRSNFSLIASFGTPPPNLTEITAVTSPTSDTSPSYTFSSDREGVVWVNGSCSAPVTSVINGNNTISFDELAVGTYSDCTIAVTDTVGNISSQLSVTPFTIISPSFGTELFDDMESGSHNWVSDNGGWGLYEDAGNAHSGTHVWAGGAYYAYDIDQSLTLASTISITANSVLSFWSKSSSVPCCSSYKYVEISTDEGSSWTNLITLSNGNDTYVEVVVDLSSYAGNDALIRFHHVTTASESSFKTWYVDDVTISGGSSDSDNDGVIDDDDAFPNDPNETTDSDSDGVGDNSDNCPNDANADQADGDGIGDACEAEVDTDSDGITDSIDNCPNDTNADQADADTNGIGDACEVEVDTDSDGIADSIDNCPNDANADQADADTNGIGDACEAEVDTDSDGIADSIDNCPNDANADQADADTNGIGDACDTEVDIDSDGIADSIDNCPNDANPDQADADTNGIGDACDTDISTIDEIATPSTIIEETDIIIPQTIIQTGLLGDILVNDLPITNIVDVGIFDSSGLSITTGPQFKGAFSNANNILKKAGTILPNEPIIIIGNISVASKHIGESLELLVVGKLTNAAQYNGYYFIEEIPSSIGLWDEMSPNSIGTFRTIGTAPEQISINMYEGSLPFPGAHLEIFFGYRTSTGTIFFNLYNPLEINIE